MAVDTVDAAVQSALNTDAAIHIRRGADDIQMGLARQRDSFSQNAHALNAAIGVKLLQSSDPEQDADFNASVRTPYGIGPSGEFVPPASVVGGGTTASK